MGIPECGLTGWIGIGLQRAPEPGQPALWHWQRLECVWLHVACFPPANKRYRLLCVGVCSTAILVVLSVLDTAPGQDVQANIPCIHGNTPFACVHVVTNGCLVWTFLAPSTQHIVKAGQGTGQGTSPCQVLY